MKNYLISSHTTGESLFIDDHPEPQNLLHGCIFNSPVAHGKIKSLDLEVARQCEGVVGVFTANDIPGPNQIGGIVQDEPLLAEEEVVYVGQSIAFVVAETVSQAKKAVAVIKAEFEELPVILDPREAAAKGDLLEPARTVECGDVDAAWEKCATIVEGLSESGAQEHLYLETHISVAYPQDCGKIKILAGTQSPTAVQTHVANVLGVGMHAVEIEVQRLGGGFGGKEDQGTPYACMAAIAATRLQRPVKIKLPRHEDMKMTGKRHAYSSDFKLGLDQDGKIVAYEVKLFQSSGALTDLSTSVMEASLLHATACYYVPNARITGMCCKTNLAPRTAFRSYGRPQVHFVLEAALDRAAKELGVDTVELQKKNLIGEGQQFPWGMVVKKPEALRSFEAAEEKYHYAEIKRSVEAFNNNNTLKKRGVAVMPICFAIGFSTTFLNQAGALLNVYCDGSVAVSTGAVEMGQNVNMKIHAIVARTLGIDPDWITTYSTNTSRVINTSPTASSSGCDLNGMAAKLASDMILARLKKHAAKMLRSLEDNVSIKNSDVYLEDQKTDISWQELVWDAYFNRINLCAQAHYSTPGLSYDKKKEKGDVYAYHVWGTSIIEVTVDCLRGTYTIDAVHMMHDAGKSIHGLIDRGQAEGALIQGLGWITMEELCYSDKGVMTSGALSTYKVPDLYFTPKVLEIEFLENSTNPYAVMQSKGIGEPPFVYSIGAYFALLNAMKAFKPDLNSFYHIPMTPEKVLRALW